MNITFLIGNGFDLNCGLKTSYKDVYNGYCKINETDSELIKNFKKNIKSDYETWGDFEWAMAKNINDFKSEDDFVKCLTDFKIYLIKYLSEEKKNFLERYDNNSVRIVVNQEISNSINNFYKDVTNNITDNVYKQIKIAKNITYTFISFNYTSILYEDIHFKSSSYKFINIHGSLENKDSVLGIDNEKQLNLKNFKLSNKGRLSFIKPIFNEKYDKNRFVNANNAIWESDIICVYGMSLGESDLTWKKLITDWLDYISSDANKHLFIYDYKNYRKNVYLKDQQMIEEESAKENFIVEKLKIEKTNDKFEKYFNKIHMPFKNIFNINETINKIVSNMAKQDKLVKAKLRNSQIIGGGSYDINRF